tara:strand:- start:442 stop:570 length:129 start_codon:yes stop_codon:yes gene_type:complete
MFATANTCANVSGFGCSTADATPKVATFNQKVFDFHQRFGFI